MPLKIDELLQLLYLDEASALELRPGDVIVWNQELVQIAHIDVRKGQWKITGSWGEECTGQMYTSGLPTRVPRFPRDMLVDDNPKHVLVRSRPETPSVPPTVAPTPAPAPRDPEESRDLLLDIFKD